VTTVSTSEVVGLAHTWANATFPWTDVYAGKLWPNTNVSSFTSNIGEDLLFAEVLGNSYLIQLIDSFSAVDTSFRKDVGLNKAELLSLSDSFGKISQGYLYAFETVNFNELLANNYILQKSEAWSVSEAVAKTYGLNKSEAVSFAEVFTRYLVLILAVSESIGISEATAKTVTLSKAEIIQIAEEWVRRGDATISDMILSQGDLTLASFTELVQNGNAPGFDKFREFIHGDYDYKSAIFRAIVTTPEMTAVNLTKFNVEVDVPDIFDRGVATIVTAANGITITFARPFHVIPEIVLSLSGGTVVAIPNAINKSLTGFTAILTDMSGVRVAGTISWAAHAY
jgi:hypothetical protein